MEERKQAIQQGNSFLGIELGSTRIKAVLIDAKGTPLASGSYEWENQLVDGIWTYDLTEVWKGLQDSYQDLAENVKETYGVALTRVGAIGISGMMHGYLAFNEKDELLVPFRTWRNTMTAEAVEVLTDLFRFNIPQRWSIAHLYQAILKEEAHVKDVSFFTTLAGYVHWKLTGKKVLGIGDASGMFPIDSTTNQYNARMIVQFDELIADRNYPWKLQEILPEILVAGENAGSLTQEGAKLLDKTGGLEAGIPLCPPEGDGGTGMVATNSVTKRTGNVSAGTSVFGMVVMERELSKVYPEIDMVTTPDGSPVAMAHCNNCTSDLNAWVSLFEECMKVFGMNVDKNRLFETLYQQALLGDKDCGGLLAYNYLSGEHVTGMEEGRPLFVRMPDAKMNLANFMRTHLYTSLGALKTGLDILVKEEKVAIDKITGHGGLFKTKGVGQSILAAAIDAPVSVLETAGEGGAWGIALLAAYMKNKEKEESLGAYLEDKIFAGQTGESMMPDAADVAGDEEFMRQYQEGLSIERAAIDNFRNSR